MRFNIKTIFLTFAVIICAILTVRVTIVVFEGEEGRLKRTIYKAKRHAERENIVGLIQYISLDYGDELGNDRQTLLVIAKNFFDEYRNILILIDKLEIELNEKDAAADIEATVYWQEESREEIIYDTAVVEARFKKENGDWKLIELKFSEPEKKQLFQPMIG